MKQLETCSCGAKIEVETPNEQVVKRVIANWRRTHKHEMPSKPYYPYWPTWTSGSTSTYLSSVQQYKGNTSQ